MSGPGVSVLIPSHGRDGPLRRCLTALAAQDRPPEEVRVVLDGGSGGQAEALRTDFAASLGRRLRVEAVPRAGLMPARVRLLAGATQPLCLSLNDDVVPAPALVRSHAEAHAREPGPAVVTGPCTQLPAAEAGTPQRPACLLDRLAAETGLIFFDASAAAAAGGLTFRHVYGLNFSSSTAALRSVGGFRNLPRAYGYDDLELAFRLVRGCGLPLRWADDAGVRHLHRVGFSELLRREKRLGRAAWAYAGLNPSFGRATFGRDVRDPEFVRFCREAVEIGRPDAERNRAAFEKLCGLPASALPDRSELLPLLAGFWVPLKRWLWRRGLLAAAG